MRLTAEEARKLSKPKDISEKLEECLEQIYSEIEKRARESQTDVYLTVPSFAHQHKEYLITDLTNNGYKVESTTYIPCRGDRHESFFVSWKE